MTPPCSPQAGSVLIGCRAVRSVPQGQHRVQMRGLQCCRRPDLLVDAGQLLPSNNLHGFLMLFCALDGEVSLAGGRSDRVVPSNRRTGSGPRASMRLNQTQAMLRLCDALSLRRVLARSWLCTPTLGAPVSPCFLRDWKPSGRSSTSHPLNDVHAVNDASRGKNATGRLQ